MDHRFQVICLTETKRLVLILGITFSVVLAFQYFELPYGSVLSSLLPAGKVSFLGRNNSSAQDLSSNYEKGDKNLIDDFGLFTNRTSFESSVDESKNSTLEDVKSSASSAALEKARETKYCISPKNFIENNNSSLGNSQMDLSLSSEQNTSTDSGHGSSSFALPPTISSHCIASPTNSGSNSIAPVSRTSEVPVLPVISISKINELLLQSHSSPHSVACPPQLSSTIDQELLYAKSQIENPPIIENDLGLYAPLYRNVSIFKRSYELMEQTLKVYIYSEGDKPLFHQPALTGIYASEGWFMKLLEANKQYVTKNPRNAHLFYLPFSSRMLEKTLYVPSSHSYENIIQYLKNYLDMIVARYPFWNRTCGADHFLVACHDWAPTETKQHMANCIRGLCNADIKEGFKFGKDVSLPQALVSSAKKPLNGLGGEPSTNRTFLAFFAGRMHGYLRPLLLHYWENKDPDMKIFGKMPKSEHNKKYIHFMKSSKYCICAKGYAVNSPRVVEAIFYECVPVIISDNYVPPLFEVLNWESFAVFVQEKDIPNLKNILLSISEEKYHVMQQRVKQVQQHFLWHAEPVKYDIFHMILHSIWYKRVFQVAPK